MLQRAVFLYALFAVALLSTGVAVWQSLETNLREEQLSDATQMLSASRNDVRVLKERTLLAERRARALEAAQDRQAPDAQAQQSATAPANDSVAKLNAELAAARQQLAAAETAMLETEDRLAEEIADHAELKAKAQELKDELTAAGRAIAAAQTKVEAAEPSAAETTGSLADPAPTAAPAVAETSTNDAKRAAVRKAQPRRAAKPVIKAVEPLGSTFEPML